MFLIKRQRWLDSDVSPWPGTFGPPIPAWLVPLRDDSGAGAHPHHLPKSWRSISKLSTTHQFAGSLKRRQPSPLEKLASRPDRSHQATFRAVTSAPCQASICFRASSACRVLDLRSLAGHSIWVPAAPPPLGQEHLQSCHLPGVIVSPVDSLSNT